MNEKILSQAQAERLSFCEEFTLWHFAMKCATVKFVKPWMSSSLLRTERSQLRWFGHVSRIADKRLARQALLATSTKKRPTSRPRISDVTIYLTLVSPVLVWSQKNYQRLLFSRGILENYYRLLFSVRYNCRAAPLRDPPHRKSGHENERTNEYELSLELLSVEGEEEPKSFSSKQHRPGVSYYRWVFLTFSVVLAGINSTPIYFRVISTTIGFIG